MSELLENTSPSAKLVYKVLEYNGALTKQQITEKTRLPSRTVRDALDRLQDQNIVSKDVYIPDARQSIYQLTGRICESDRLTPK